MGHFKTLPVDFANFLRGEVTAGDMAIVGKDWKQRTFDRLVSFCIRFAGFMESCGVRDFAFLKGGLWLLSAPPKSHAGLHLLHHSH